MRFAKCSDFDSKRQFVLDYVDKIIYWNEKVELHGSIPVSLKIYERKKETMQSGALEFCIKDTIQETERLGRKDRQPDHKQRLKRKEFEILNEAWNE